MGSRKSPGSLRENVGEPPEYGCGYERLAGRGIFVRRISHGDRLLQIEVEFGFGWDAHLLAFCGCFGRGASASSDTGANRRTFAAAKNASKDRTDSRADADRLGRAFAARLADILIIVTGEGVRLALEIQPRQLQGQLAAAGHAARRTHIDELDEDVSSGRYDGFAIDHDGKGERSSEKIAGVIGGGIHAVNHLDMNRCACGNAG